MNSLRRLARSQQAEVFIENRLDRLVVDDERFEQLLVEQSSRCRVGRGVGRFEVGGETEQLLDDAGELNAWLSERRELPAGVAFPIINGPTAGRPMSPSSFRYMLKATSQHAGIRRRIHPHIIRHTHAVELWRETCDIYLVCRQLGHANPAVTMAYLQSLDPMELLGPVGLNRAAPVMAVPNVRRRTLEPTT